MKIGVTFIHCVNLPMAKTQMFGVHYMPIWAYTLSSHLKKHFKNINIQLFDNRVDSLGDVPQSDYFLFTGINQDYDSIIRCFKEMKSLFPQSSFLIGGPLCWSFQQANKLDRLRDFNHIFIGDGEENIVQFFDNINRNIPNKKILQADKRFDLAHSQCMDRQLIEKTFFKYYGGVIEVSRGCPFLCEFCDIRIFPDNNKSHCKNIDIIIEELNIFHELGIRQVLFSCDNFIGNPFWAKDLLRRIIEWRESVNTDLGIYTWLTINLANDDELLFLMKKAGFDMFFIGVESFGISQLFETAKVQNTKHSLVESIKKIQSHGFIIVAGLIFGFDTDKDDSVEVALRGIEESGLISGDPSLLTALPGTPLYKRMLLSNRLREEGKLGLGGAKYHTNIKYLRPKEKMISDFKNFVKNYNEGSYQYLRYKNFLQNINFDLYTPKGAYISASRLLRILFKNNSLRLLPERFLTVLLVPSRVFYFMKGLFLTIRLGRRHKKSLLKFFNFWFFVWSNNIIKYSSIKNSDFDIDSVDQYYDLTELVPEEYMNTLDEPIALTKIRSQRMLTKRALSKLIPVAEQS